jgi:restriction system protein
MVRKRSTPLGDSLYLIAQTPWWLSAILAVISYLVLAHFAAKPLPPPPGRYTPVLTGMIQGLAMVFQYVVPLLFIVAAAISAFRQYRTRK